MPNFDAEQAKKLTEQNQLPVLLKQIEARAKKGYNNLSFFNPISEKILTDLKDRGFKYSFDEEKNVFDITW